jgi:hypothetical protein
MPQTSTRIMCYVVRSRLVFPSSSPTIFELIVNRTTANTVGQTFSPDVVAQATEWID